MITREEFARHWDRVDLGGHDSPLWIPEHGANAKCNWFICINPIAHQIHSHEKLDFWLWCDTKLNGIVRCFSSNYDDQTEWWGFESQQDAVWWMLKWGN